MKRVIVDYAKLTTDILDLLVERYPDGYDHSDIISFKNSKGETIKAVEVNTEDTLFLVKISSQLQQSMEDHETDDEENDDTFDEIEIADDFDNE
ncbi:MULTISPECIES: hypothetical protein [Tenacibaculum]|uniref:DNA primase n=2 Tax=Tenacibaculum TaxID=104267 RepID=A0AAE9MQE7_9FLAO|nr:MULTISPECIES: hypothetical protein [Tenacibaculum]GFD73950.1 hypothetical protein KUL113_33700 [Tenacibaculum sp. KUL113]GFD80893.1 hypothetical protein KUL118_37550 [Tenacibaculum sp. KUL118]GFD92143.1 hypothetical protein KUL154_08760 [Alteromonas sp. KUL154]GFE00919.1 hypothetical protein KUL156_35110 [Alteromonas sp. KUL156]AZJ33735.1 hypothetical protein D6200_14625 [Tenacibaculum mesophilum]